MRMGCRGNRPYGIGNGLVDPLLGRADEVAGDTLSQARQAAGGLLEYAVDIELIPAGFFNFYSVLYVIRHVMPFLFKH